MLPLALSSSFLGDFAVALCTLVTLAVGILTIVKLTRRQPKIEDYVDSSVSALEKRVDKKLDALKGDLAGEISKLRDEGERRVIRIHGKIDDNARDTQEQITSLSHTVGKGFSDISRALGRLEGRGNG